MIAKSEQLAQDGNCRRMRADAVTKDAELTFLLHRIKIRRIGNWIAIQMHVIAICRLAQNKDDVLNFTIVFR